MTRGAAVCALLVAVVAWQELLPAARAPLLRRHDGAGRDARTASRRGWSARGWSARWWSLRRRPGRAAVDVAAVLTEVASRLRAGAPVAEAWTRTLARAGITGPATGLGPRPARAVGDEVEALAQRVVVRGADPQVVGQVAAAEAASRLADRTGAPLADVLDRCAAGIVDAARAESARRVALAGPASTARLLGWLPLAGLVTAWALGANPVAVLLDGRLGSAAGLAGVGLLVLGHRWTAALVAGARAGRGATDARDAGRGRARRRLVAGARGG